MYTTENTTLHTWFERDRAHIELRDENDDTIIEWWDEEVEEMFEDGFFSRHAFALGTLIRPHVLHQNVVEYVDHLNH